MHAAPILMKAQFSDIDEFSSTFGGWDLDFRQLDAGALDTLLEVVACSDMVIHRLRINRRVHQQGCSPNGILTFGLPDTSKLTNWQGSHLDSVYTLVNFNRRIGFDAVSEIAFTATTLSISVEAFNHAATVLGADVQAEQMRECADEFSIKKTDHERIKRKLDRLSEYSASGLTTSKFTSSELQVELALTIVAAITNSVFSHHESIYSRRQQAVNRALGIINSTNVALSISDLYQDSACSWRTLDRGFQERFGVTPKQYLLTTRMASVRREILASPAERRITDIANNWGFWHLGRFSTEYKRMFGESPSATIRA